MAAHRSPRGMARLPRKVRRPLAVLVAMALVFAFTGVALAFFTATGSGLGSATAGTLAPPTAVTAVQTAGTGTVTVTWHAPAGSPTPDGYVVTRTPMAGSPVNACGTSPTAPTTATSCADTSVPLGSYTYNAVAIFRSWTATSTTGASVSVVKAPQTITFGAPPAGAVVGGHGTVSATGGGSGNPVTFTSATPGVCTVSGATLTYAHAGSCTVLADQAGATYYQAAVQASQSVTVAKAPQVVAFSTVPPPATVGGTTYTPAATGGASGNPVTISVDATSSGVCTITPGAVSYQHVGTCTLDAQQAGNADYLAGSAQQSVAVGKGAQAINFGSVAPTAAQVGGATYAVAATATSGLPVTFSSGSSSVCQVSGTTVSFVGAGTCVLHADQPGNADYDAAGQATQSFPVTKQSQTISFTSPVPPAPAYLGSDPIAATATSGLSVSLSSATPGVCSVASGTVSYVGVGVCTIDADQAGNATYAAAAQAVRSYTVARASQTLTFGAAPTAVVGGASYTPVATSSAGLTPVTYSSQTPSVCSYSAGSVSFLAVGTCTIAADQAGNGLYLPATQTQSIAVGKGSQTVAFTSTPVTPTYQGSYTATASGGGSSSPVVFSSVTTGVCTTGGVNGSSVSFVGAGSCTLHADQAGDANYLAAPQASQTFTVAQKSQTITFTSTAPANPPVGGSAYTPAATGGGSGNAVTFTIDASTTGICSISAGQVTYQHVGTCLVDANQAGTANYAAAPQAQQSIAVGKGTQAISFTSTAPAAAKVGDTYTVAATATPSGLPVVITSATTGVCTISGATVTMVSAGTCTLNANQAGDANYNAATQVQQSFTVGTAAQTITITSTAPTNAQVNGPTYTATASASSGLTVTFSSGSPSVCSSGGTNGASFAFLAAGTCVVNANQAGNATYSAAPQKQQTFTVSASLPPVITNLVPANGSIATDFTGLDCSTGSSPREICATVTPGAGTLSSVVVVLERASDGKCYDGAGSSESDWTAAACSSPLPMQGASPAHTGSLFSFTGYSQEDVYTATVTATNSNGVSASASTTFAIDAAPPTVTFTPASPGYTSTGVVTISGTDGNGIASIAYRVDSNTGAYTTVSGAGPVSFTLGAGTHTVDYVVTDGAGRTTTGTNLPVILDTTAPVVTSLVPADGAVGGTFGAVDCTAGSSSLRLCANVSDANPVTVTYQLKRASDGHCYTGSGSSTTTNWTTAACSSTAATTMTLNSGTTYRSGQILSSTYSDGDTYLFTVTATDGAGNSASTSTTFYLDTTGPVLTNAQPANGGVYDNDSDTSSNSWSKVCTSGRVCVDAADGESGVASVTYVLYRDESGTTSDRCWNGTSFTTGSTSCTAIALTAPTSGATWTGGDVSRALMAAAGDSANWFVRIVATNNAGQQTSATYQFTVS